MRYVVSYKFQYIYIVSDVLELVQDYIRIHGCINLQMNLAQQRIIVK